VAVRCVIGAGHSLRFSGGNFWFGETWVPVNKNYERDDEPCPQPAAQRSSLCGSLSAWTFCPVVSILRLSFGGWLP